MTFQGNIKINNELSRTCIQLGDSLGRIYSKPVGWRLDWYVLNEDLVKLWEPEQGLAGGITWIELTLEEILRSGNVNLDEGFGRLACWYSIILFFGHIICKLISRGSHLSLSRPLIVTSITRVGGSQVEPL